MMYSNLTNCPEIFFLLQNRMQSPNVNVNVNVTAFDPTALLAERVQNISVYTVYTDIFCTRSVKRPVGSRAVTRNVEESVLPATDNWGNELTSTPPGENWQTSPRPVTWSPISRKPREFATPFLYTSAVLTHQCKWLTRQWDLNSEIVHAISQEVTWVYK